MPRKALYDIDQILSEAVEIFREHSFHGTAMDELIARTEFNRRAFYLEFHDKRQFLYKVLAHYQSTRLAPILAKLNSKQGLQSIQEFFVSYIGLIENRGCLLVNCITELAKDDIQIQEIGRHYLDDLQVAFISCLEHANAHQQLSAGINLESVALQLSCAVQGLAVNANLCEDKQEMQITIQSLLSPLLPKDR